MKIDAIHSYLVHPVKNEDDLNKITGTSVPEEGSLRELMENLYKNSDRDCRIDIVFNPAQDGSQQNDARDLIVKYLKERSLESGRLLAEKLARVSSHRSGLGLLFLITGIENNKRKIVVARFPADSGILAREEMNALELSFIEQVFMKNSKSFKSVMYRHADLEKGFWVGKAIDKQVNSRDTEISAYWITKFLESDFRTTSAEGTRRLASAMRAAARKTENPLVKQEITAAATLANSLGGQNLSIDQFFERFGFSEPTRYAVREEIGSTKVVAQQFIFDVATFKAQVPLKAVDLDTGVMLMGPADRFDKLVTQEESPQDRLKTTFLTTGRVVDQTLRKGR